MRSSHPMRSVQQIDFVVERQPGEVCAVMPTVDGVALQSLIADFERLKSFEPSGGYGALVPSRFDFGQLEPYLMGSPADSEYFRAEGGIYLLGCECGEVGCWPLVAKVCVNEFEVRWSDFAQPFREERDYRDFAPFVFERTAYETAARRVTEALRKQ